MGHYTDMNLYIENWLHEDLELVKESAQKGMSPVFCIDGYEQTCKSTLAAQLAYFLDPSIKNDLVRVTFNREQCEEGIKRARDLGGDGRVVVLDEAGNIFDADSQSSKNAKWIKKVFQQCGKYHIIFIMCSPSIFDLSTYARIHRINFLLRTYTKIIKSDTMTGIKKHLHKGYYMMYPMSKKISLIMKARYKYDYGCEYPEYVGHFLEDPGKSEIYGHGYEAKKDRAFDALFGTDALKDSDKIFKRMHECIGKILSREVAAKILGYAGIQGYNALLRRMRDKGIITEYDRKPKEVVKPV